MRSGGTRAQTTRNQEGKGTIEPTDRAHTHLLHVVPVGDDAVLNGVLEREDATLALRLVADVGVLLVHADHDARVLRAADDGWEDGARRVVAGEARLAHAGASVDHERLVARLAFGLRGRGRGKEREEDGTGSFNADRYLQHPFFNAGSPFCLYCLLLSERSGAV